MSSWVATKCFACSTDAGVFLFNKKDFEVCKNGIHCDRFIYSEALRKHIRNKYGIAEQTYVIGSVGQFRKQKNYAWLSKPLADLVMRGKDVCLLLVGDGECREEIERAFTEAGVLDKVIFAGVQADTAPFYSAMDIFVLPSLFEGLGIVAVEAQANGLPCILSEGVPSETALGNSVRYLPLDSPEKWADALAQMPQRCENGGETVHAAGYDISATTAMLQEFYLQAYSE
jgi:glycosyltransferase involved in cell wall biosynthesis